MDMALSFLPLTFSNKPLTSAAAASSLDFSLRIFKPFDITRWHLHEQHTERGASARTFSIGRMYDEGGEEVAHMSQACIMRPLAKL
jgi:acyl-CoA thioesterase